MTVNPAARDAAAEAAARLLSDFDMVMNVRAEARGVAHVALAAALPHLTAEDVPHVTAQVRAETLREAADEVEFGCQAIKPAWDRRTVAAWLRQRAAPPAPTEVRREATAQDFATWRAVGMDGPCRCPRTDRGPSRMTTDAAWTAAITTAATNALRGVPGTRGLPAVIASEATRNAQKETDHG